MSVGFEVDCFYYTIGTADFLNSFFSTVFVKLECSRWGSRFPILMNDLYQGVLPKESVYKAQEELATIKKELELLPPSEIVWDFDDLSLTPPWGDNISPEIRTMADYFVTSEGENLLSVLDEALRKAVTLNEAVTIVNI
ncbi:Imm70 family immunity protein [Streptococcus ovuberis]|uniref:Immunity protein 70 n=1 Tax=Streptococcus ovuberis TaxID=1936207 RepID=A0A7X6S0S6_9STRE|nr:hypothetical protein [Streptococcus ovuberis]